MSRLAAVLVLVASLTSCGDAAGVCAPTGEALADGFVTLERVTSDAIPAAVRSIDGDAPEDAAPLFRDIAANLETALDDLSAALETEEDSAARGFLTGLSDVLGALHTQVIAMADSTETDDLAGFVEANGLAIETVQSFVTGSGPQELRTWLESNCESLADEVTTAVDG